VNMKILLSNDDGYLAEGLAALALELKDLGELTVIAPDRNQSGSSHALTLDMPLRVSQVSNSTYFVNGTPTDCVHLAVTGLLEDEPDMVVSGINHGSNLGDDVLYSGTVAAAVEGRFFGFPSIAVSLVSDRPKYFDTAAKVTKDLILQLLKKPLPGDTVLNVNVPDVPYNELAGFESTRLGSRHRSEPVFPMRDPKGRPVYWVGPAGVSKNAGPGTDFYAVEHNRVSITPLQIDLTRHDYVDELGAWLLKGLSK